MLNSPRQSLAWFGAATALTAVLFTGYLLLRTLQPQPEPTLVEELIGVTLLGACAAGLVSWTARRAARKTLRQLSEHVAALREDPSLSRLQSISPELGPVFVQLEALSGSYRQALENLAAEKGKVDALRMEQNQTEAALQALVGRPDSERGRSRFRVHHSDNNGRNLVARLTPNLHWIVATPALLQFVGDSFAQLNGKSCLDMVPAEDRTGLKQSLLEALETGEGHNITFRFLVKDGVERHVQMDVLTRYGQGNRPLHLRCFFTDITHRVRTDSELRRLADELRAKAEAVQEANTQLRRINRELDDFSYVVSHDLKEPLRTLEAFSNFLAQDYGDQLGGEGQEFINHLIQASRRLGSLIDDLLTLSRAGRVLNSPQFIDIAAIAETVRLDLADLIQRKGAVLHIEEPLPKAWGDPQRITQLFINLVTNGLKYNNNPRPDVSIGSVPSRMPEGYLMNGEDSGIDSESESDVVTLFVRDNGIGIDPQYHEQIFRIFRRLHRREDYEGTGAGLAISKKIIEAHGGRIWVESEPDCGATFYFTIPALDQRTLIEQSAPVALVERPDNDFQFADQAPETLLS